MKNNLGMKVLAIAFLIVAGCAAPPRMGTMSVATDIQQSAATPLRGNISVKEVFGVLYWPNPWGSAEIGNEEFRGALESALESAGLQEIVKNEGMYSLSALLVKVDQPVGGFTVTIRTHVKYTLTEKKSGKSVYKESIVGEFTANASDSLWGPKRCQIATVGAARDSIDKLIKKLLQLEIAQ